MIGKNRKRLDFLCIGAQKAATSWLWSQLKAHEGIWLPPRKELHYFDRSLRYPSPSFLATGNPLMRLISQQEHNVLFRSILKKELRHAFDAKDAEVIRWFLKYFFGWCNDSWYASLFDRGQGKVKGEITPSYSILNRADVARVRSQFPDLKIIFILRNPIERAWSQVRFFMTRGTLDAGSSCNEIFQLINSPIVSSRGEYVKTIDTWRSCFPEDQIHIGFYDQIENDPSAFLADVLGFLEVDTTFKCDGNLRGRVNRSLVKEMPGLVEEFLAEKYLPEMEVLATMLPGYPDAWLRACRDILDRRDRLRTRESAGEDRNLRERPDML